MFLLAEALKLFCVFNNLVDGRGASRADSAGGMRESDRFCVDQESRHLREYRSISRTSLRENSRGDLFCLKYFQKLFSLRKKKTQ